MRPDLDDLFGRRAVYPESEARERLARLVGLDDHKERLTKMLGVLVHPDGLMRWAKRHHVRAAPHIETVMRRPPLVILGGDVGTGKTELASTVGDAVARTEKIDITLFPLSLSTRGQGQVGEMTHLISAAFDHVVEEATKLRSSGGKARGAIILLVDEADALAQSREAVQMHHEDRAGVNAFIRGVDSLGLSSLPVAVILCTNRLDALDPAIQRRAADVLAFARPDASQRREVLGVLLEELEFAAAEIDEIVTLTGSTKTRAYGFTYSDLTQRLLPALILDAFPSKRVEPSRAKQLAARIAPTPPFRQTTSL